MNKLLLMLVLISGLLLGSNYDRAKAASAEAIKNLDCEFDDCKKEPEVIIQEKIVEKEVPVEKIITIETTQDVIQQSKTYSKGQSASLSEALYDGKIEFDKKFIKHIRATGTFTNGTVPVYQKITCADAQASLVLHRPFYQYAASIKYGSHRRSFNLDIGSISFHFETTQNGSEVSVNDLKPVLISKNKNLHENVNNFSVISKNGKTEASCNGILVATIPTETQIRNINAYIKNHFEYCGRDDFIYSKYSDKVYDMSITELINN